MLLSGLVTGVRIQEPGVRSQKAKGGGMVTQNKTNATNWKLKTGLNSVFKIRLKTK